MVSQRLHLSGIDEGLEVRVVTKLRGADSPSKVSHCLRQLFPDLQEWTLPEEPSYLQPIDIDWMFEHVNLRHFLSVLHQQKILDTALDVMSANIHNNSIQFSLSRQAAFSGKIAFPIPNEVPLGGVLEVYIEGIGIRDWLEAATWHPGRTTVPRMIDDDLAMHPDGDSSTWH